MPSFFAPVGCRASRHPAGSSITRRMPEMPSRGGAGSAPFQLAGHISDAWLAGERLPGRPCAKRRRAWRLSSLMPSPRSTRYSRASYLSNDSAYVSPSGPPIFMTETYSFEGVFPIAYSTSSSPRVPTNIRSSGSAAETSDSSDRVFRGVRSGESPPARPRDPEQCSVSAEKRRKRTGAPPCPATGTIEDLACGTRLPPAELRQYRVICVCWPCASPWPRSPPPTILCVIREGPRLPMAGLGIYH